MEARRIIATGLLPALTLAAGCQWLAPIDKPSMRAESPHVPPAEPLIVQPTPVTSESTLPSGDIPVAGAALPDVERWAMQVPRRDEIRRRTAHEQSGSGEESIPHSAADEYADDDASFAAGGVHLAAEESGASRPPAEAPASPPSPPSGPSPNAPDRPAASPARLTIRAEPESPPRTIVADSVPRMNAPQDSAAPLTSVRELLRHRPSPGETDAFADQLDHRVLSALAGDLEAARRPLPLATAEQQAMATHLVESIIAIRSGGGADPASEIRDVLRELDGLYEQLAPAAELSLPTLVLCRSVRGFGVYESLDNPVFTTGAGIEFVTYAEVRDFATRLNDNGEHISQFGMKTTVLTSDGDIVLEIQDADIVDRCRSRRRDCFVPRLVRLPSDLSAGSYVVKITLMDKIGGKVAEARTTFQIATRP